MYPDLVVVATAALAAIADLRTRRVHVVLSALAAALGAALSLAGLGVAPVESMLGLVIGLAFGAAAYASRGLGLGDVWLLGAIGAIKGGWFVTYGLFYGCTAAAIIALVALGWRGELWSSLKRLFVPGGEPVAQAMAFAPAMFAGVAFTLYLEWAAGGSLAVAW